MNRPRPEGCTECQTHHSMSSEISSRFARRFPALIAKRFRLISMLRKLLEDDLKEPDYRGTAGSEKINPIGAAVNRILRARQATTTSGRHYFSLTPSCSLRLRLVPPNASEPENSEIRSHHRCAFRTRTRWTWDNNEEHCPAHALRRTLDSYPDALGWCTDCRRCFRFADQ